MAGIKKNWWKLLGALLIMYALIAGIKVPLKPGIYSFDNSSVKTGELAVINITGYNTHFAQAKNNAAWLKIPGEDLMLKSSVVVVKSDNQIKASIPIPSDLDLSTSKGLAATLIVDNEIDGYALYPQAVRITASDNPEKNIKAELYNVDVLKKVDSFGFPYRNILYESIRNIYFHVAIWFAMFLLLIYSCYCSIKYLINKDLKYDYRSSALTSVALWFGIAGILTGSLWAKFTWGAFWTSDIKLNMSAVALLVYFAYWILRHSINDIDSKARISAVYNLFAFVCLMVLVMVIPRLTDSLHPGNGGNPALGGEDLDNRMRMVFYPAIIGYTLIGLWISQLIYRMSIVQEKLWD